MLTRYLIESGDNCVLSGALPYGLFFNIKDNVTFFKANGLTLFDKLIGFNFYLSIKAKAEDFKQLFGEHQATKILQSFRDNKASLMDISERVLAPFFGYSDLDKYYDDTQSVNRLH
jgi:predicted alpha/beta-fold hydrolase